MFARAAERQKPVYLNNILQMCVVCAKSENNTYVIVCLYSSPLRNWVFSSGGLVTRQTWILTKCQRIQTHQFWCLYYTWNKTFARTNDADGGDGIGYGHTSGTMRVIQIINSWMWYSLVRWNNKRQHQHYSSAKAKAKWQNEWNDYLNLWNVMNESVPRFYMLSNDLRKLSWPRRANDAPPHRCLHSHLTNIFFGDW